MKSGIYIITNVVNNKVYIGSSENVRKRLSQHRCDLKRAAHRNPHLQSAWNTYGIGSFHFSVLEYCDITNLKIREDWWIDLLSSRNRCKGYNLKSAERNLMSEESKAKISASRMGDKNPAKRPEVREKIAAAQRGRPRTEETKEKLRLYNTGKILSEEHKSRIGISNKGNQAAKGIVRSPEFKKKVSDAIKLHWESRRGVR